MKNWLTLLEIELKSLRQTWHWSLGMACLYPLSLVFFLKFSSSQAPGNSALYAISGGMVFALVLNTTLGLGQEIALIKETSGFDLLATLPISKTQLVLAILARSILLSLPAVLIVLAVSKWVLAPQGLRLTPAFIPVLFLSCLSLAGAGALLGFAAPSARFASFATQAAYILVAFFSPVMFPLEALPIPLQWISKILPTTYAADALRRTMVPGGIETNFWKDTAVLTAFAALSLWSLMCSKKWRTNE